MCVDEVHVYCCSSVHRFLHSFSRGSHRSPDIDEHGCRRPPMFTYSPSQYSRGHWISFVLDLYTTYCKLSLFSAHWARNSKLLWKIKQFALPFGC